jgi:hypothetical protein
MEKLALFGTSIASPDNALSGFHGSWGEKRIR